MPAERVSMRQIREVLRLRFASELPQRGIAKSLGLSQGAVSGYLSRARAAGVSWPLPADLDDEQLEGLLFPPTPFSTASSIAPIASTSKAHRCAGASLLLKAPLHDRPCADRPRGPTAPPHARRSVAREGTARRARVPSVDSVDDPLPS